MRYSTLLLHQRVAKHLPVYYYYCLSLAATECYLCIPFWDNTSFFHGRSKRGEKTLQSSGTVCRPGKIKETFFPFLTELHLSPFFFLGNDSSNSVLCHFDRELHHFSSTTMQTDLKTINHFPNTSNDFRTLSFLAVDV